MNTANVVAAPRRVGVVVKPGSAEGVELGKRLLAELARRGVEGVSDQESSRVLGVAPVSPRATLGNHADVLIVLGGDGTFLSVTRDCPARTPVAGINLGTPPRAVARFRPVYDGIPSVLGKGAPGPAPVQGVAPM